MPAVAFQGEAGAFSETAAIRYFGKSARLAPSRHFEDVFRFAAQRASHRGILPIENSVFGSVHEVYDLLLRHRLSIVGEITLGIHHHLLALPGIRLKDLRFVFSHPQALGQCERFLRGLNHVQAVPYYDTAGAAKMIREERRADAAALASARAAQFYRLDVLRRNVENNKGNVTRFVVVARRPGVPSGRAKTSLVFAVRNMPGALFRALAVFALRNINLFKIESRPVVGKPWEYLFYLDIAGARTEAKVGNALRHLREVSTFLRVLGSYSVGRTVQG